MRDKLIELIQDAGIGFVEKKNTIRTTCPLCHSEDKFSILKSNGSCICYRGSCDFGRRWFEEWVSLTMGITIREARMKISNEEINPDKLAEATLDFTPREEETDELTEIPFPEFHMVPINSDLAKPGVAYLENRGISLEMMQKYEMTYSPFQRRVYFPIKMNGRFYGYQGRAIDKVDESMRMRNNDEFRRDLLVMFADNLEDSDFAIIAEGPVDALKFEKVGANVCTMGKVVTDQQLETIYSYGVSKLFLALDDDAAFEMNEIVQKTHLEVYRLNVPESCVARCAAAGKKADFGECTYEEAEQAFQNATKLDQGTILMFVPKGVR